MIRVLITFCLFVSALGKYQAVDTLDLDSYMGEWFEVYENRFDRTFQNGKCVKAHYKLNDNNVTVLNTQIKDDKPDSIGGFAYYKDGKSGGYLTVKLDDLPEAPYWVIELGPIINNLYDYAIVSDNFRLSLFVLARNIDRFFDLYNENVLESLKEFGFTNKLNEPLESDQTGC